MAVQDRDALPVALEADDVLLTAIGAPDDAAWDGVAAEATVIALLKKIALNTEPA